MSLSQPLESTFILFFFPVSYLHFLKTGLIPSSLKINTRLGEQTKTPLLFPALYYFYCSQIQSRIEILAPFKYYQVVAVVIIPRIHVQKLV